VKKTKPCPKCGGTMEFRLGDFECAECGHTESAEAVSEKGKPKWTPPPPTTPPAESMAGRPSRLQEMSGEPAFRGSPPRGLTIEKVLILVILVFLFITTVLTLTIHDLFPIIIPDLLITSAIAVAFFTPTVSFKWSCFGCSIVVALPLLTMLVWGMFEQIQYGFGGGIGAIGAFFLIYGVLALWIGSVLYRDIRCRKRQDSDRA